jgi:hypothetical protein
MFKKLDFSYSQNTPDEGPSNSHPSVRARPNVIDPYPAKMSIDIVPSSLGLLATRYPRLSLPFTGRDVGTPTTCSSILTFLD